MKFAFLPYNDAAGTSAKAVYLRDTIMPAVQKILSEIFTVETWDNSILNTDECTIDSTTLALPGVSGGDEDFYLMYDMFDLSSGTIAKAGACYILTSNSRPIVGIAAFDPDYVGPDSSYSEDGQIKVALHEVFHAIGFSGSSFPGLTTATTRGKTRNFIASATVLAKAKEQAGCDSLKGAELEDEGGSGTAGSHFEERVYGNELMTGIVNTRTMKVSSLSLAVMEDSGWSYVADYNKADTLFWGKEKGCSFHDDFCLTLGSPQTTVSESTFPVLVSGDTVNSRGYSKYGCTMGREYKGVATAYYTSLSVLPTDYQYYSEDTSTRRGNGNIYMEYCPYYSAEEAYSSSFAQTNEAAGNCRATVDLGANAAKEVYGANSRCFMVSDGKPYCFEYGTLAASNMTMIKVAGATEFSNCTCTKCDGTDGTTTVVSGGITITCPPVSEIYGQSPNLIERRHEY